LGIVYGDGADAGCRSGAGGIDAVVFQCGPEVSGMFLAVALEEFGRVGADQVVEDVGACSVCVADDEASFGQSLEQVR
jgi:hypothetical protein